jgi:hypothetical protein
MVIIGFIQPAQTLLCEAVYQAVHWHSRQNYLMFGTAAAKLGLNAYYGASDLPGH